MPNGRIPKLTKSKVFKRNRFIERERLTLEATEKLFVVSHKQFMNNVLMDLERTKIEKDSRRDELWNSSISQFNSTSLAPTLSQSSPSQSPTRYSSRKQNSVYGASNLGESQKSFGSAASLLSKKKRACNREDLYTCLLDSVDPPKSPKEWFGTIPREYNGVRDPNCTSEEFDVTNSYNEAPDGTVVLPPLEPHVHFQQSSVSPSPLHSSSPLGRVTTAAMDKWEAESIFKALQGSVKESKVQSPNNRSPSKSASPTKV
jgi:hypothetical protein